MEYQFSKVANRKAILALKKESYQYFNSPPDGMWDAFRDEAISWQFSLSGRQIAYACVNEEPVLIQFYIKPEHLALGGKIFKDFIEQQKISKAIVGTNNPIFMSLMLPFASSIKLHTYLFRKHFEKKLPEKDGYLREATLVDLERIVHFCHQSTGAPKNWLEIYVAALIAKGELFFLEKNKEILGTCEVRRSQAAIGYADIGMIVSPAFRRQAYGSFLLNKAKNIALDWGLKPICSCESGNIGSIKAIQNCGFVSEYQLLEVVF